MEKNNKSEPVFIKHNIEPVYTPSSTVLILGSFPSVRSRESGFYYGHPRNRFWQVLSAIFNSPVPDSIDEKKKLLYDNNVALWDVIAECVIKGSSDASIKDAKPNDIGRILDSCPIQAIYTNGKLAYTLYCRLIRPVVDREAISLVSTSPANAAYSLERLVECWEVVARN